MNRIHFLRESIRNLRTVGTVARSSKYLCRGMIRHIRFDKAENIVELGPGDGVITEYILKFMRPDSHLWAFEVNDAFCDLLTHRIHDNRFHLIQDSAEYLGEYMAHHQLEKVDYIISAIPFIMLPEQLSLTIIRLCQEKLREGGKFIQLHYSPHTKKMYQQIFGNVEVFFVPLNIPPAFVMVSTKHESPRISG